MRNWIAVYSTLIIALILTLLPMPGVTVWMRPAWVLMVLIFWAMTMPDIVNIGTAWLAGLVVDLLTGTMLGEHALAYTVVIFFVSHMHLRLIMYPLFQQAICILFFTMGYQFLIYSIQGVIGEPPATRLYWLSSLTSMFLWPWLFILMRDCRRRFITL